MYLGRVVEQGPVEQVFAQPHHPYTRGLLDSVPSTDPRLRGRLKAVTGEVPSALNPPPGCAFAPRCVRAREDCRAAPPPLMSAGAGRSHACLHPL
jgi:oligopeptide/dipeptide ABC transporter ATP-binding protein